MANDEDLARIRQGVPAWNDWRQQNLLHRPDLRRADLSGSDLNRANLSWADLRWANLQGAKLWRADLSVTHLVETDFTNANLEEADLRFAILLKTNLTDEVLTGCSIYGISAWDVRLDGATQNNLVITNLPIQIGTADVNHQPEVRVDNLEVAQFMYLFLNNMKVRDVIDTITSKVVLILGRFTQERKSVLDAIREELRKHNYLPVLFDFDGPASRDVTETISLLASMARFVVADITDARSIPQELTVIAPNLPSVPIQPLLQQGATEYGMFEHFRRYPWVLKEHVYATPQQLIADLRERVIGPAEAKVRELRGVAPGAAP
jgi:uncharacterized protein YjbI with pentapeptide repeats